jgi:hypothetical protein
VISHIITASSAKKAGCPALSARSLYLGAISAITLSPIHAKPSSSNQMASSRGMNCVAIPPGLHRGKAADLLSAIGTLLDV